MTPALDTVALDFRLLDEFQREFPLVPAPFAAIAVTLQTTERAVLETLARLTATGAVSRVGAVFRPGTVGASTLAALAAPGDELDAVAQVVGAYPEVSHNYERENAWNLWFVASACDAGRLDAVLGAIEARTGKRVLRLPLVEEYHIDLGFRLAGSTGGRVPAASRPRTRRARRSTRSTAVPGRRTTSGPTSSPTSALRPRAPATRPCR